VINDHTGIKIFFLNVC